MVNAEHAPNVNWPRFGWYLFGGLLAANLVFIYHGYVRKPPAAPVAPVVVTASPESPVQKHSGWTRRCALAIDHTQVRGPLTNFPVLVSYKVTPDQAANLPDECMDSAATERANGDGGDLRFTSDADGNEPLHSEVVSFVQAHPASAASAEIWVCVPSVSSPSDTVIYAWYGNAAAAMPAEDDPDWGSQGVWSNGYAGVWHLTNPASPADSTRNVNDGTSYGRTSASAQIGDGIALNGPAEYLDFGAAASLNLNTTSWTYSVWFARTTTDKVDALFDRWEYQTRTWISNVLISRFSTMDQNQPLYHVTRNGNTWTIYKDGAQDSSATNSTVQPCATTATLKMGFNAAQYAMGILGEGRVASVARSAGWIATEYNNQSGPSTFWTTGTPEACPPPLKPSRARSSRDEKPRDGGEIF